ncbi:MAG: glycosyltransferase family 29 protein [Paracoccaceae bacterium]
MRGKRVAIVGNARALADMDYGEDIDEADLVVRINRAPRPSALSHGTRTDWLALATSLDRRKARSIGARRILWMSPKRKRLPLWALDTEGFYLHPDGEFASLRDLLGAPPTTGLMMIDMAAESEAAAIDLYGFDFFASLSLTGSRSAADVPHDFGGEAAFVEQLIETDPRVTLYPMK